MRIFRSLCSLFAASLSWCVLLFGAAGLQAQVPKPADPYVGESAVIERMDAVYTYAADGTGWRQRTLAVRVQSEAALKQVGVVAIPFAGSSERVEFHYARVRRPDGTVVETPVSEALEITEDVTRAAPFYSDLKQKQLPIRNLRVGDTLEWEVRVVRTRAEAPGEFWGAESFVEDGVVLEESVELRFPVTKTVKVWSPTIKPEESAAGGQRVFHWASTQLKPTIGKAAEDEAERKKKMVWTPEQELDATEGKLPAIAWTTFPSWEAVGAWYRGLEGDRMDAGPDVKAKVAEVTAGKGTEEEKVRAVYGYVASQIRYIGIAFGVGRYQPHRAAEVLENQYGDCKDKHTLLAAMLGVLGLKPDAVLIGAGIRFNPEVPSPAAFNHLITRVVVDGKPAWLDATAEVAPYRMLVFVIRDHAALVVPETGVARVERTPKELPFKPFQKMEAVGTLDKDGVSESKITITLRGDDELALRAAFRQFAPAQYDQAVQRMSQGMGYAGTTSHPEIGRVEDTAEPLTIRYDYHREKAGNDWDHYRTIAQLAPVTLPVPDEKDPPVRPIQLGVPRVESSTSAMKLPEGWGAELPEGMHSLKSEYATVDQSYRFEKGTLYAARTITVLVDKVPSAEWKKYKKFADEVYASTDLYVQLIPAKGGGKDAKTQPSPKVEPEETAAGASAEKLVALAYEAMQKQDFDEAQKLLDQVKTINAKQRGLWGGYGFLVLKKGQMTEATEDYEKEIALHPDESPLYPEIARLDHAMGKEDAATDVLRRWVAADPQNPQALSMLCFQLVKEGDAKGGVRVVEAGISALPEEKRDDANLHLQLGVAQMKAGDKAKGAETLVAILKTSEDAWMLNSAAYELADAGAELPLAEKSTRAALDKLGEESRGWTLNENMQILRAKSGLIVATWDTLGWVYFREGRSAEAEAYLRAAWLNGDDAVVAEHLGDVLAAKGDRAGAAKAYELSVSVMPKTDALGIRKETPGADELRVRGKIRGLGAGAKGKGTEGIKTSQEKRTFPLGASEGRGFTAEYKVLLGPGGVELTLPVSGGEDHAQVQTIKKVKLGAMWPAGSDARLARMGFLNCHSGVCELVLEP